MDNEFVEIKTSLPYRAAAEHPEKATATQIAYRMLQRHGYWMALYHCTTLMMHCHKLNRDKRLEMENIAFWYNVRQIVYKQRPTGY